MRPTLPVLSSIIRLGALCSVLTMPAAASAWELPFVDLKIGLRGGANISLLADPPDSGQLYQYQFVPQNALTDEPRNSTYIPYTNYYGTGWNAGAALNVRFVDIVALEFGYQRATESARGTIELADVRDCSFLPDNPCYRQEVEQEFSQIAHHVPIVAQFYLPLGVARPFISLGVDVVVNRTDRQLQLNGRSPLPSELDPSNPDQAATLAEWNASPLGQNLLRAELNPDSPDSFGGFIAGLGVDIVLKKIEIPVEFRMHLYPSTGGSISQRGNFGTVCPRELAASGGCADPLTSAAPQYNDVWTSQFFILFGLDYLLF